MKIKKKHKCDNCGCLYECQLFDENVKCPPPYFCSRKCEFQHIEENNKL